MQRPPPAPPAPLIAVVLVALVLVVAGCTGPVRSLGVYESKAARTAKGVRSAVENARLAVQAATERKAFGRYLSQVMTESDDEASSIQSTFDAIQPPDRRGDQLRSQLDDLLQRAVGAIDGLRIAIRRGDLAALPRLAAPLPQLSQKLDDFAQAHQ
jgi:hypothetical protein